MYGVRDELAAWCFDRAIYLFGNSLDADLARAEHGAKNVKQANLKRQQVMHAWLGTPVRFRDPAAKASGEVRSDATTGPVKL